MAVLNFTWVSGSDSGNYVRLGHSDGTLRADSVWSFVAPTDCTKIQVDFAWDNNYGSGGYKGAYTYLFGITDYGTAGRWIYGNESLCEDAETIVLEGKKGSFSITFKGLNLTAGNTYYLRANQSGTKYKTVKALEKAVTAKFVQPDYSYSARKLYVEKSVKQDSSDTSVNALYVCGSIDSSNRAYASFSTDGSSFTQYTYIGVTNEPFYDIQLVEGELIACGGSTDGVFARFISNENDVPPTTNASDTWESVSVAGAGAFESCVKFNGCYICNSASTGIWASADGETFSNVYNGRVRRVVVKNKTIWAYALGDGLLMSYDGFVWQAMMPTIASGFCADMDLCEGGLLVLIHSNTSGISKLFKVNTYTLTATQLAEFNWEGICIATHNGQVLISGAGGHLAFTTDITRAFEEFTHDSVDWNGCTWGLNEWLLVGNTRKRSVSCDGRSFTAISTSASGVNNYSCSYGLSEFERSLYETAKESLGKHEKIEKISGDITSSEGFALGDIVEISAGGVVAKDRITEIRRIYEAEGNRTVVSLGGDYLDIRQLIKRG